MGCFLVQPVLSLVITCLFNIYILHMFHLMRVAELFWFACTLSRTSHVYSVCVWIYFRLISAVPVKK